MKMNKYDGDTKVYNIIVL